MAKRSLPTVAQEPEALGEDTIMDPVLAARHGVEYVHLVVFAIDVDRVRELVDEIEELGAEADLPFGWEVFLTETYLLDHVDPRDEASRSMIEDACLGLLEARPEGPRFGEQLPFAVHDAVRRGAWPPELGVLFRAWRRSADRLVERLAPLWAGDVRATAAELAAVCLEAPLDPPLAPPTAAALTTLAEP